MGTTFWPYHPMESARCFFLYEMHSFATGIRKAGLKDSNARQRSVAKKNSIFQHGVLTMSMMKTLCLSVKAVVSR